MAGVMVVRQRVDDVGRFAAVFNDPDLDAARRRHGLVVTGTYADADDPRTVIVVMDMNDLAGAQRYARSSTLAEARQRAGVAGPPEGVWYGAGKLA
jgi:hypothetical protein